MAEDVHWKRAGLGILVVLVACGGDKMADSAVATTSATTTSTAPRRSWTRSRISRTRNASTSNTFQLQRKMSMHRILLRVAMQVHQMFQRLGSWSFRVS